MPALDAKPALSAKDSATNEPATNATSPKVIAYYFHGTVRCETCLLLEGLAKVVIEEQFKAGLDAKRLIFLPLNYDLPGNAHFLTDYKLPCPSLALVRQTNGQDETWKLLGDTWQLVQDPVRLNNYVATDVRHMLGDRKQRKDSRGIVPPPAADAR